jgi:hypothetical protein
MIFYKKYTLEGVFWKKLAKPKKIIFKTLKNKK